MKSFEWANASTVEDAVKLLKPPEGKINPDEAPRPYAGGQDLLTSLKAYIVRPNRVVNLKTIPGMDKIELDGTGGLKIGANATVAQVEEHPEIRAKFPGLAEAAASIATPQIRNLGTVGGNLCQRPRCWYFRAGYGLLAQRDGKSMVLAGDNRYHAVLGNAGPAYFVHPSTLAPLLIALGAQLRLAGPGGERRLDLASFYRAPRTAGESEHALGPGELVTEVLVPPLAGKLAWSYEIRQRQTLDWSLATAAVVLGMEGGKVASARVVLGQVAPVPWRAQAAEELLRGKAVDAGVAARAGEAAVEGARPLSRNRYKIQLARVAVERALLAAAGRKEA